MDIGINVSIAQAFGGSARNNLAIIIYAGVVLQILQTIIFDFYSIQ